MQEGLKKLSELKIGEKAIIAGFINEDFPSRFYEIGIIPGVHIKIYQKVPLNGPVCFIIGNGENKMALRKKEARLILVQLQS